MMSQPKHAPRSLRSLPLSFGGAFCPATSLTISWVSAHDVISAIPPLCIRVRDDIRHPLRGRTRKGCCAIHRFSLARRCPCGHASCTRRRRPRDGLPRTGDLLVWLGSNGCTRGIDARLCCLGVTRAVDASHLAGMGMVGSRALDDRVRLSHTSLVSVLTGRDFRIGSKTEVSALPLHFRFIPQSRHQQSPLRGPVRATSRHCPPFEWHTSTDQASTRLIGPRKSILPTLTPLWRRMA
jgi:hypothetical protein